MAILFALILTAQAPFPDFRVGRIIIEGNTDTPDRVILQELNLFPGQKADSEKMRKAEQRLRAMGLFKSNPWRGAGATVELAPNDFDNEFKDVLVRVEERPGNWLAFGLSEVTLAYLQFDYELLVQETLRLAHRTSKAVGNHK